MNMWCNGSGAQLGQCRGTGPWNRFLIYLIESHNDEF